jgi:hypothetical protein
MALEDRATVKERYHEKQGTSFGSGGVKRKTGERKS